MSYSKFPRFGDGDVIIGLPSGRLYLLHVAVLRRSSEYFSKLLAEDLGAKLTPRAKREGVTVRYRIDLFVRGSATSHDNTRFILKVKSPKTFSTLLNKPLVDRAVTGSGL